MRLEGALVENAIVAVPERMAADRSGPRPI